MITIILTKSLRTLDIAEYTIRSYVDKTTGKEVFKIFATQLFCAESAVVNNAQGNNLITEYRPREVVLGRYSSLGEAKAAKSKIDQTQIKGEKVIYFD